jgi:hypothetical protein
MAHYSVKLSDGRTAQFDHPDEKLSQQQVQDIVFKQMGQSQKDNQPSDWKGVVRGALREAAFKPGTISRGIMGPPGVGDVEMQANAITPMLGMAGSMAPIPGGSTLGTGLGQGLRDASLKLQGKQIPSLTQHGMELAGSVLGDLTAFPAINKARFGSQIGQVEKAAGMPAAENIASLERPTGVKTISSWLDETMRGTKTGEIGKQPIIAKQIKDQVNWIYEKGKQEALSSLDKIKLAKLSSWAEKTLNETIAGRAAPAANLARSQTIPRTIGKAINALPPKLRGGIAYGSGVSAAGYSVYEIMKKLLGR